MKSGRLQHHVALVHTVAFTPRCTSSLRIWRGRSQRYVRYASSVDSHGAVKPDTATPARATPPHALETKAYQNLSLSRNTPSRGSALLVDLNSTRTDQLESPEPLNPSDFPGKAIPITDRAKYLFRIGKGYLKFYKTGLGNIWRNYKLDRQIRQELSPYAAKVAAKYGGQQDGEKRIPNITRAEYLLTIRTHHDLFKLIPFGLIFAICGEFTPLVIIALGSRVVPFTCRIPKQEQKDLKKQIGIEERYRSALSQGYIDAKAENPQEIWKLEWLEAFRLGLTPTPTPYTAIGPLWHKYFIQPRLKRRSEEILCDTVLVHREGGFQKLTDRDIFEWADKYGLSTFRQMIQRKIENSDPTSWYRGAKRELSADVEAEAKFILNRDWTKVAPSEQWRAACQLVGSKSPDAMRRANVLQELSGEK